MIARCQPVTDGRAPARRGFPARPVSGIRGMGNNCLNSRPHPSRYWLEVPQTIFDRLFGWLNYPS